MQPVYRFSSEFSGELGSNNHQAFMNTLRPSPEFVAATQPVAGYVQPSLPASPAWAPRADFHEASGRYGGHERLIAAAAYDREQARQRQHGGIALST